MKERARNRSRGMQRRKKASHVGWDVLSMFEEGTKKRERWRRVSHSAAARLKYLNVKKNSGGFKAK